MGVIGTLLIVLGGFLTFFFVKKKKNVKLRNYSIGLLVLGVITMGASGGNDTSSEKIATTNSTHKITETSQSKKEVAADSKAEKKEKAEKEKLAKIEAEKKDKAEKEKLAKIEAEKKDKDEKEKLAKIEAEKKDKAEKEKLAKIEAEKKDKAEKEKLAKIEAEKKDKAEKEKLAKIEAEKKDKDEKEKLAKIEAEKAIISDRQASNQDLAELPISDVQTIDVNGGKPQFTTEELSLENGAWEKYGDLDQYNRPTYAEAMLNQSLMPSVDRESLHVNPTGWRNKKIKSGYLYNRSHLIGFQFTGQNNNLKNLITGTRELNSPEMLRFEMDVAHYLKQSADNYVRYSVIPVFRGDELVARGVHMQAQSVDSDGISFNVFIANTQHGVEINYQDGTSQILPEQEVTNKTHTETENIQEDKEDAATQSNAPPAEADTPMVAEPVTETPVSEDNTEQTVYITATGKKYHLSQNCRGLNNANGITETTLTNAQSMGLDKCGFE